MIDIIFFFLTDPRNVLVTSLISEKADVPESNTKIIKAPIFEW